MPTSLSTADLALYLDMDGVLADFDVARDRLLPDAPDVNRSSHELSEEARAWKERLYDHIRADPDFYFALPPCDGALHLYRTVRSCAPVILTAAPSSFEPDDFQAACDAKWRWCVKHLGLAEPERFVCTTSRLKPSYIHHVPGRLQVLVDDRESNCAAWAETGGVAIQHTSAPQTLHWLRHLANAHPLGALRAGTVLAS